MRLDGVDLLELTGGHDADARAWSGIRQYNRTTVADGGFKAALYAARANHGQFNTEWGAGDYGPWSGALLDLAPLPAAAEQEDVARTAIGAFLEASLHDETAYRGLFRRPMVGREWLPDDVYLVRSDDGTGTDLVTMTLGGDPAPRPRRSSATGWSAPRVMDLPLRALQDTQQGKGGDPHVDRGRRATRDGASRGSRGRMLARSQPAMGRRCASTSPPARATAGAPPPSLAGLAVEAWTTDGARVTLPLSTWGALPPPLETRLTKNDIATVASPPSGASTSRCGRPRRQVVQSYVIPLEAFAAADPSFVPARLDGVVLRIPRTGAGSVAVTGLRLAPAAEG